MNSLDVHEYIEATAEIETNLRIIGEIFSRTKMVKMVFIRKIIKIVDKELDVKLYLDREGKKES